MVQYNFKVIQVCFAAMNQFSKTESPLGANH